MPFNDFAATSTEIFLTSQLNCKNAPAKSDPILKNAVPLAAARRSLNSACALHHASHFRCRWLHPCPHPQRARAPDLVKVPTLGAQGAAPLLGKNRYIHGEKKIIKSE